MKQISIIIVVKADKGIHDTLESLYTIPKPNDTEILVIASGGGDLDDIRKIHNKKVRWYDYHPTKKKHTTIPEQRNMGIQKARGDIIVFIDANCIPQKNWLKELIHPIIREHEYIVSGATLSLRGKTHHDSLVERNKNKKYLEECATINLAFKRVVADVVGPFDEKFDYGSDVDFIWRAREKGYKIRYAPSAIIRHDWGNNKREVSRSFKYGIARARLYKKHLTRLPDLTGKDILITCYALYILFLPITYFFHYYPLIILIPIIKNWNNHPVGVVVEHLVYACGFWVGMLV